MNHCFRQKGHSKSIQSRVLYPVKKYSHPGVCDLFRDDNGPIPRAEWYTEWFDEYENDVNHTELSSQSPHLENLD